MAVPRARDSLEECGRGGVNGPARDDIWHGYWRDVRRAPHAQISRARVDDDDVGAASSLPKPTRT
jgi:hypothetical protein